MKDYEPGSSQLPLISGKELLVMDLHFPLTDKYKYF